MSAVRCLHALSAALAALAAGGCAAKEEGCAREPAAGAEALELLTRDDVCLSADLFEGGGGDVGVLLVHAKGEDASARTAAAACFSGLGAALAIDRRGAGASAENPAGVPDDDADRFDVEAGAQALNARGFAYLYVWGDGEAATGALDYGVWARGQAGLPRPDGVALTGVGPATEARSSIAGLAGTYTPAFVRLDPGAEGYTAAWDAQVTAAANSDWDMATDPAAGGGADPGEIAAFMAAITEAEGGEVGAGPGCAR